MWSFGTPDRKWDKECINPVQRERGPNAMVWACFTRGRRSELIFMNCDQTSERRGQTATSLTETLEQELVPFMHPNYYFMEDNWL